MASMAGGRPVEISQPSATVEGGVGVTYTHPELWRHLEQAATVEDFTRAWLELQCRLMTGVVQGVVVLGDPGQGPYAPTAFWPDHQADTAALAVVAELAMSELRGVVRGHERSGRFPGGKRVTDVAYPLLIDGRLFGVVALQLALPDETELGMIMRQLQWGTAWLELRLRREQAGQEATSREHLPRVLEIVTACLEHPPCQAAATAVVTELATLLQCDRVSIGFLHHRHIQVKALSHSAQFGQKTNLIRQIGAAMDEAMDQQATIISPPLAGSAPLVTRAHAELGRQQGATALCTVPLHDGEHIIGGLTLERTLEQPFDPATVQFCEAVAALVGPILETKRRDDRWLYQKAGAALQAQWEKLVGPRHLGVKLMTALLVGTIAFLALATGEYRVSAHCTLEGIVQRLVVAPLDGYILEAYARAGDIVREAEVLAKLDERDLKLERLKWIGQKEQYLRQYREALTHYEHAQSKILEAQIEQADAQIRLLDEQIARCQVLAPFNGLVVSGDLSQSLGAPVSRGEVLFTVAPLDHYRVILKVDERDISQITVGQQGKLALTGEPGKALPFSVDKLTPLATAEEGRNYFRVEARLLETPPLLRPGMAGIGKIDIGERQLLWVWTHELIDWLRLWVWSWWP